MTEGAGYSLDGATTVVKGQDYRFKVNLNYGFRFGSNFKVLVNNVELVRSGEFYVVTAVEGDIVVTVVGVEPIPETYWIVVDGDIDTAEYTAATILHKYILQMTGKDYVVVSFADLQIDSGYNILSVGNNTLLGLSPFADMSLSGEQYALRKLGKTLYIAGQNRGALYGVYEFLRQNGCEFFAKGVEVVPSRAQLDTNFDLVDEPDFEVRAYLSYNTCYGGTDEDLAVKLGQNSVYANNVSVKYGQNVKFGYIGADTHNMRFYIDDDYNSANGSAYWGTTLCPAADVDGTYTPCLTNGIDYNLYSTNTFSVALRQMKKLMSDNPSVQYFTFQQEDGSENNGKHPYCTCEHCNAAANTYGRTGVMLRFVNKLAEALRADSDLVGRDFRLITLAYSYTTAVPTGGVGVDKNVCVWYAAWGDMRYGLSDSKQFADIKTAFDGWKNLTRGDDDGELILWLYDIGYNNYVRYFPSSMAAVDTMVDEAKAAGVKTLLVLGAYDAENIWQSEMRAYVWARKMADSSLKAVDLRDEFIGAYFGTAAAQYVIDYVNGYDNYIADNDLNYAVQHGRLYMTRVTLNEHVELLKKIDEALQKVNADSGLTAEQKAVYTSRLQGVRASSYCTIMCYWDATGDWKGYSNQNVLNGASSTSKNYVGGDLATIKQRFREAAEAAGITRCREGTDVDNTLDNFVDNNTNKIY